MNTFIKELLQFTLLIGMVASIFLCLSTKDIQLQQLNLLWGIWCAVCFHINSSSDKD